MWNKCAIYDFFKFEFILKQIFLDLFFGVRKFLTPIHSTYCGHFKLLFEDEYIRYHFIFQALQVFFYESTCHVLYLIFFYLLRIFLNILCENFLCFISYLLQTFFNTFLEEYSLPIHFFVTANARNFLCGNTHHIFYFRN